MLNSRRLSGAGRSFPLLLALWSGALAAQDANTVGPPQLRDFTLPGRRTTPPVATQPAAPPPAATAAPPIAPRAPTPRPPAQAAPSRQSEARQQRARTVPPARNRAPFPAATTAVPPPAPAEVAPPLVQTSPQPTAPAPTTAPAPPEATPASPGRFGWWPWLLAALALAAAAGFFLLRRRTRAPARGEPLGRSVAAWRETPEPAAVAVPEPLPEAGAAPRRARLEVDINPDRAAATDDGALVHYALILTNRGDAAAGNIRIDGRMFNASADGAVDAFFRAPIHEVSGSPHVAIAPGQSIALDGQIGMPKAELQAIEVQGRLIFVPLVAINVAYDWEGGSGRTSTSWLVGRQPASPEAKMGAFRLDLGPRIYRQVERRQAKKRVA
jgi:hypothetical protein